MKEPQKSVGFKLSSEETSVSVNKVLLSEFDLTLNLNPKDVVFAKNEAPIVGSSSYFFISY